MNNNLKPSEKVCSPFIYYCQKVIPLAFDESMSYYEQLCNLVYYLKNTVMPAINNNADALTEVQDAFKQLEEYVDNYFKNLDVQTEINNKLDEMAESGQLTEIITQYLELAGILAFNDIASLQDAENLNNGSFVKTYGRNNYNDGYGAFYKIRTLTSSDVIDEYNIVSLINYPTLIAEKINDANIKAITSNINNINDTINNKILPNLNGENYKTQRPYYYIDGINGDDNNEGTAESPFKTIDKFLSLLNSELSDIRAHIVTAGTYNISKTNANFTNAVIHLVGDTNNIVITNSGTELVFYCGHLNLENLTLDLTGFYTDNTINNFKNCVFKNYFKIYGGDSGFDGCKTNSFRQYFGNCYLANHTIDGKAKTNAALYFGAASVVVIENTFTIEELEENCADFFVCYRSYLCFCPNTFNNGNTGSAYNYSRGLVTNYVTNMTNNTMNDNLQNVSSNNSIGHTLTITGNVTIPN